MIRHPDVSPSGLRAVVRLAAVGVWALGALLCASCSSLSNSELINLGVEYWQVQPKGSIRSDEVGSRGDKVDVEDILDLDGEEAWIYRAGATTGPTKLEATWIDLGFDGVNGLTDDIDYGDSTFPGGDDIKGELDTTALQLHASTLMANWNFVQVGIIVGVDWLQVDTKITSLDTPAVTASADYEVWVPVFGASVGAAYPISEIELFAEGQVSGMLESLSLFGTIDGDYLSGFVRGGVNIDDGFKVGAGYRAFELDVEDGRDRFDYELGGGFLFLDIEF